MALKFKDASDFKGRNVDENLYNIKLNSDRLSNANDIILSIHFNGFNEKATGAETWSYLGDNISKPIAQRISKDVAAAQGIVNRGQKSTTDLYVVSQTRAHMILIEICFLDNKKEIENYIKNKTKVINAIIKACEAFPQYNFTATHGGHHGLNMMDPGVSRHGYKEAVLAQEINQALLKNKQIGGGANVSKPKPNTKLYHDSGVFFKAKRDLPTYTDDNFSKKSEWVLAKGSVFGIKSIYVGKNGNTHALVEVNWGGIIRVTLNKDWVEKIK